jgi:hypothetical protein
MSALGRLIVMAGCAGALVAPAQTTFIMHMDSVQNGFQGAPVDIEETPTGFVVAGMQDVNLPGYPFHTFIRKLSADGHVVGESEYFANEPYRFGISCLDPYFRSNDEYVGGLLRWSNTFPALDNTLYFVRYDTNGDTLTWKPIYSPLPTDSLGLEVNQTIGITSAGYAMCGRLSSFQPDVDTQGQLLRLNELGDTLWTRSFDAPDQSIEFFGLAEYSDNGFVIAGMRLQSFIDDNYLLIRTDSIGNEIWRRQFGDATPPGIPAVRVAPDSTIITWTRYRNDITAPPNECVLNLRKWDANGTLVWNTLTQGRAQDMDARDMEVLPDGSFICGANYYGMAGLWKFDANGDSLWLRNYYDFPGIGAGYSLVYDVLPTSDGGFAMCGEVDQSVNGPHPNLQTWFVVKTDSMGCVVPGCQFVGLNENAMGLQNTLLAYPNPSSGRFTLTLTLPATVALAGDLTLQVFDTQGRLVERRNLGRQLEQTIALDLTAQPTGLYSAHLSDGKRILTGVRLVVE